MVCSKATSFLVIATFLFSCSSNATANPAINLQRTNSSQGVIIHSIFLDLGDLNNNINTFEVLISPDEVQFLNVSESGLNPDDMTPYMPDDEVSFVNALIALPPELGGLGLFRVGGYDDDRGQFFYAAGPLGGQISVDGPIFLGNVVLAEGNSATARVRLFDAGMELDQLDFKLIPEPNTAILAMISALGVLGNIRRHKRH